MIDLNDIQIGRKQKHSRRGRPASLSLTPGEAALLRSLTLAKSSSVDRLRKTWAIEEFCRLEHDDIRTETRAFLQERLQAWRDNGTRPNWPASVMRACHVTQAEMDLFRGKLRNSSPQVRRGNFIVDKYGREIELKPLMVYTSDDVSINEQFRWIDAATGRWMAGRQVLSTIDWGSAAGLANTAIGRPKDAYRAEDIADHMLDVCQSFGLPLAWILEQGSWNGTFIHGIEVEGMATKWGALDPYLFAINNVDSSRGKGLIEERFDMMQVAMAVTEGGITMGRWASDFRQVAKLLRRVSYDRRRAEQDLAFSDEAISKLWTASEAMHALTEAWCRLNARPVQRHWSPKPIVPDEALAGAEPRPIPTEHRWRFSPIKRAVTVRGGCVELSVDHYSQPFRFAVSSEMPTMVDGYKVLVAFHPGRPEEGAHIANRERGPANRHAWGMGEIVFNAPYVPLQPVINLSDRGYGPNLRRKHESAVRTEFRPVREALSKVKDLRHQTLADQAASQLRVEQRDGQGQRSTMERQATKQPATRDSQPATRNPNPVTRISNPKSRLPSAETRNAAKTNIERKAKRQGVEIEDMVL